MSSRKAILNHLRILFILCGALLIALLIESFASRPHYPEAKTIAEGNPPFGQLEQRFITLAKAKGGVYAYGVLRESSLPIGTQVHLLGHDVGDVLYEQQGPSAIKYCTPDFGNACSHSIAINTIERFGSEALPMLQAACQKVAGGMGAYNICMHGVGHGIFADSGYSLQKTVPLCVTLGTRADNYREYQECVGGSIMELISGGGHDREQWLAAQKKYFDPKDPLSPCDSSVIPENAKQICYIYLTPRLFTLAGSTGPTPHDPVIFAKAFSFCDLLPKGDAVMRDACFGGFGKEFDSFAGDRDVRLLQEGKYTDAQVALIDTWCSLAGSDAGRTSCSRNAVSSLFWGGEYDPSTSFRFCAMINSPMAQQGCYQELTTAIMSFIPAGFSRDQLCIKLPPSQEARCESNKTV